MVSHIGKSAIALALAVAVVVIGRTAQAHAVGLSRGEYTLAGGLASIELTFARRDVEGLETEALLRHILVSSNGKPCSGEADAWSPTPPDAATLRAHFTCEDARSEFSVRLTFFADLPEGHRHVVHLQAGALATDDILYRSHDTASLTLRDAAAEPLRTAGARPSLVGMVRMGAEHVLTGYDHLVFLFGLALVGGRPRSLLAAISAFTVAHSLTLGVAAMGVWTPPPQAVEAAIAFSIAYVGVENLFVSSADKRWRITFPFGLLHGFGFAGALREIALAREDLPRALLSFNLGVEVGQLIALAALVPTLVWLRRSKGFAGIGVRALSAVTAVAGALWFVVRVVQSPL
jgi:hypothetical protein